jgi:hypothetical protein
MFEFAKENPLAVVFIVAIICSTFVSLIRGRAKHGEDD